MRHVPSNQDNIINSRDIIARIAELQISLQANFDTEDGDMAPAPEVNWDSATAVASLAQLMPERWARMNQDNDAEEMTELLALLKLQDQCEGYSDWRHGETLIAKSHFVEYAEQLAEDCGMVTRDATWPHNFIDWDAAADALSEDYAEVDFDGEPFYIRNC